MARILWLYKYIPSYDFDNWLHMKFVEALDRHPAVKVMAYGPDLHVGYPNLAKVRYNPSMSIHDLKKVFDFDAIVMNTKSRMFMDYNPHPGGFARGQWLPKDIQHISVPRIVIEEDYHYETTDQWYTDLKVDLILQRHWSQSLRQQRVPMRWFPFSVDTGTFYPSASPRINKICFAGSTSPTVYKYRHQVCDILGRRGLIEVFAKKQKIGAEYPKCLREYVSHLSCSSTYNLSSAKMFEIMASGSALLTNENDDLKHLFEDGSYYTYKKDMSNIEHVARSILNDLPARSATVAKGLVTIEARHTHEKRIAELIAVINEIQKH